jgi:DNA polymerase III alpha subunit (gram-positive type)
MPLTDKFERMGNPFNVRIKAVNPCDAKALAVNKLDPTIGFTKAEAWTKLKEWRKSAMIEKIVPLGHNPQFDLPFILMLSGNPEEFRDMFHYHNRCTMAMAQVINDLRTINNLPKMFNSLTLSKVAATLGIDTTFAHTAEGDCEITRLVFKKMLTLLVLK